MPWTSEENIEMDRASKTVLSAMASTLVVLILTLILTTFG